MTDMTRIRYPNVIYTDSYAEGPFQFPTDERFVPAGVTAQATGSNAAPRDVASFIQINGADLRKQQVAILMTSPVWNRAQYDIVIDESRTTFQYFV